MKETLITCILERLEILYEKKKNVSLIDCFYSKWINNYLFSINKEIITYANISQLPIILNSLLNDSNKRQKIAFKAKARVLRDHTYEKRMYQMLSFIFPKAKIK